MNNHVTIDGQGGTIQPNGLVRFGSDETVNVLFYTKSVLDPVQSRERGRPYHVSLPYVRIQQPGEKDYIDRPVTENDAAKHRWPHHWARYEGGQKPAPAGTPLECLFPQHPEIAANLHTLAVHTVEQLAGLTAHGQQTIGMGATEWQRKAKEFLAAANGGVGMHRLQQENDKLKGQIEVQGNQIALMKTQIDRLLAAQNQKIPPAMIPNGDPTLAQQFGEGRTTDYPPQFGDSRQTFPNDDLPDTDAAPAIEASDEPMFVEEEAADSEESLDAPPKRRGGWPAGKPRKPHE
ncbi:MAG: hypothetical protein WDN46_14285 [Methylocella sp.]